MVGLLQMMVLSETVVFLLIHKPYNPIIRGFCPDSVTVLFEINPVNLHWKKKNKQTNQENQVKNRKFAGFTREIILESQDIIKIWPGRARTWSVEVSTR